MGTTYRTFSFVAMTTFVSAVEGQELFSAGGGCPEEPARGAPPPPAWEQALRSDLLVREGMELQLTGLEPGGSYELRIEWGAYQEIWRTAAIGISARLDGVGSWRFNAMNTAHTWLDRFHFVAENAEHRLKIAGEEGKELDLFVQRVELRFRRHTTR